MDRNILYGGTFNPIHYGHVTVLEYLSARYDQVILMPNFVSPHKTDRLADVEPIDRYNMAVDATLHLPNVITDIHEIDMAVPSYTIDTIKWLMSINYMGHRSFPNLELAIGTDQYLNFDKWTGAQEILSLVPINVLSRPGYETISKEPDKRFNFMTVNSIDVSSTEIRRCVAQGESIQYMVPPEVDAYIKVHDLYKTI